MKKVFFPMLLTGLLVAFMSQIAFAGAVDNKQNFSARYIGNPSRNAATDGADVAAYNPAGIMMQENGLAIELDVQYLMKEYDHSFNTIRGNDPTNGFLGEDVSRGDDEPAALPTFFATYKRDKWGLYASFTVNGGGGTVDYSNGNNASQYLSILGLGGPYDGVTPTAAYGPYTVENQAISVTSIYYTFTTGATFAFTEKIAAGLGVRYIRATKEIEASGDFYFNMAGPDPVKVAHPVTGDEELYGAYDQEATGYGFVLSFDYKPLETLNLALRYESEVALEFDTDYDSKTKTNLVGSALLTGAGIEDGEKYDRDLAAVLGFGVAWDVIPKLNLSTSINYYFEEQADWGEDTSGKDVSGKLDHNTYEVALGLIYSITPKFRLSTGYLYTNTGFDPDDYGLTEAMSPPLDCHSFGIGAGYDFLDRKLSLEFGAMANNYVSAKGDFMDTINTKYEKQVYSMALGLQWRPF